MTELIGQVFGDYRIEAILDTDRVGQVFQARHLRLDRLIALKVLNEDITTASGFQSQFLQAARTAATLHHPNIVEIYDFGEQNNRFYLVMELLPDGSLRNLLQHQSPKGIPLPLILGLDLVRQAADGLAYAHAQGIVHGDIAPKNLLLTRVRSRAIKRIAFAPLAMAASILR